MDTRNIMGRNLFNRINRLNCPGCQRRGTIKKKMKKTKENRIPKIIAWIFTIFALLAKHDELDLNANVLYQLFIMVIVLYVWWLIIFAGCKWIGKFFTKRKRK